MLQVPGFSFTPAHLVRSFRKQVMHMPVLPRMGPKLPGPANVRARMFRSSTSLPVSTGQGMLEFAMMLGLALDRYRHMCDVSNSWLGVWTQELET